MFGIIYKITCLCNSKVYIGLTTNTLNERWSQHKSKAHSGKYNLPICNAIRKYGDENFKIELIDEADTEIELKQKEMYWIDYFHSTDVEFGYNVTLGGESGYGYHHTDETKERISQKTKGKKKSKETVERMKQAQQKLALTRHIIPSEETRQKMSESRKGHLTSDETKTKISLSNSGKVRTEEQNRANRARQIGKKILHNDNLNLNIVAFAEDIEDLIKQGWQIGKNTNYTTTPRKEFLNRN